jgi:hypothetical protein
MAWRVKGTRKVLAPAHAMTAAGTPVAGHQPSAVIPA